MHVDGLFAGQNVAVRCRVGAVTSAGAKLTAAVRVSYIPGIDAFALTALMPVGDALDQLLPACPNQGDPIDGLQDEYFIPGFSFAGGYGPGRWFTSATVTVPAAIMHQAARIRIPLGLTPAGRPPRDCAVPDPRYQRCRTGGRWTGLLTLIAGR